MGGEPLVGVVTEREEAQHGVPALWIPHSTLRWDMRFGLCPFMDLGARASVGPGLFASPNRSWIVPIQEDMAVWSVAVTFSFRIGDPDVLAYRMAFEWGMHAMPVSLYRCVSCETYTWYDTDGDGLEDDDELEQHLRDPIPGDTLEHVYSKYTTQPHFLVSVGMVKRLGLVDVILGASVRTRYENRGLRYSSSAYMTTQPDDHPYVVPYLGVDLHLGDRVVFQLMGFFPIDTAYEGQDGFWPGISTALRVRFPVVPKPQAPTWSARM